MNFTDELHRFQYQGLLSRDNTKEADRERKALFYILSCDELFKKANFLYNFDDHSIKADHEKIFSSGEAALIEIGYNLYNGYGQRTIVDLFSRLDSKAFSIALEAIRIRFDRTAQDNKKEQTERFLRAIERS